MDSAQPHMSPPKVSSPEKPGKRRRKILWFSFLFIVLALAGLFIRVGVTFSVISGGAFWKKGQELPPPHQHYSDPDRLNVLLLGIRGEADPHGGLLTDTIMLISIHKPSHRVALFSVPRDLYVDIPEHDKREKVNFAYALGFERGGWKEGLRLAKETVEDVTDVAIDYAVVVDFKAFQEVTDILGGVDVYVRRDFKETEQFSSRPIVFDKGIHHMDGETALYYVRSRYSTSDFDRARRQQDVLLAAKTKALKLGILANPKKVFSILRTIERHVRTDADFTIFDDFLSLARDSENASITRMVFDASEKGFLRSTHVNDVYVLLPKGGNFASLQTAVRNVFP